MLAPMFSRAIDALLFSSLWVALAAAALTAAAAAALGVPPVRVSALAGCGTLVVYVIDRLRDLERDRCTAPERSAFVAVHQPHLRGLAALSGCTALGLAAALPWQSLAAPAAALPLALLHRRLKRFDLAKATYVTAAWVAVTTGLPAGLPGAESSLQVALALGLAVLANAIASNVRDEEAGAARFGQARVLRAAHAAALAAIAVPLLGPAPVRPLAAVGVLTWLALHRFRRTERYGLGVIDGALVAGALASLALGTAVQM